jgi:hypothetical protein
MDVVDYYRGEIRNQGQWLDVYRQTGNTSYDSEKSAVGKVCLSVSAPSSSSEVNTEGTDQSVSMVGLIDPTDQRSTDLHVGDELRTRPDGQRRYRVETRDGLPNDFDTEIVRVGLSKRNVD